MRERHERHTERESVDRIDWDQARLKEIHVERGRLETDTGRITEIRDTEVRKSRHWATSIML